MPSYTRFLSEADSNCNGKGRSKQGMGGGRQIKKGRVKVIAFIESMLTMNVLQMDDN